MELWKWIAIIVILALVSKQYAPEMYEQSFAKVTDYGKEWWDERNNLDDTSLGQDIVMPDGTIVTPSSGKIYGQPYDYFDCSNDMHCQSRFSVTSVCDLTTGECIEP